MQSLDQPPHRPLRLGMVGGGPGSNIGATHRQAARLDGRYELVAGVFASDAAPLPPRWALRRSAAMAPGTQWPRRKRSAATASRSSPS